jgi:hypothetical protein
MTITRGPRRVMFALALIAAAAYDYPKTRDELRALG